MDVFTIKNIDEHGVKLNIKLGEGRYGTVWEACIKEECNYILKITESTSNEVLYQTTASKVNLSVPIIDNWVNDDKLFIIMKKADKTAKMLLEEYNTLEVRCMILASCLGIITKLHMNGICHGDPHLENIMVTSSSKKKPSSTTKKGLSDYIDSQYTYIFIDFATSKLCSNENKITDYNILGESILDLVDIDETLLPLSRIAFQYIQKLTS